MDLCVYEEGEVKPVMGTYTLDELVMRIVEDKEFYLFIVSTREWKEYERLRHKFIKNRQDKELGALANLYLYRRNKGKSSMFLTNLSLDSRLGGLGLVNLGDGDGYMVTFVKKDPTVMSRIERALKETGEVEEVIIQSLQDN